MSNIIYHFICATVMFIFQPAYTESWETIESNFQLILASELPIELSLKFLVGIWRKKQLMNCIIIPKKKKYDTIICLKIVTQ